MSDSYTTYDLAIVGSGFGGSLLAMVAQRIGLSVILLERGRHPRFAIGESTSPLTNLLIEEIADRYDLPRLLPLTTYGAWQRVYPEVSCGLKRGFTYYHHEAGRPFVPRPDRANQLLVAASPSDAVSDTHWFRADVDHFLQREAAALGVDYVDEVQITSADGLGSPETTLSGSCKGESFQVKARFVVDASGPRGFLSRLLNLKDVGYPGYPNTQTFFSHFENVARCDEMEEFRTPGEPPYRPDDAALHHVFDGGWMWVLRLNNGITSAGFAVTDVLAAELALDGTRETWERFLKRFPTIGKQFHGAKPVRPFVFSPKLSYRSERGAGSGWAMLPSAAGFIDPLFSTGFPLTLIGIERLGVILSGSWGGSDLPARLAEYERLTLEDLDATAMFVGGAFAAMPSFEHFAAYSMFYFAAASYSEMARRLGRRDLASRFLAQNRVEFADGMRECAALLKEWQRTGYGDAGAFAERIGSCIEPLNVAGLADDRKRNWYPVDLGDVVRGAGKLGLEPEEMRRIIATAPWARTE